MGSAVISAHLPDAVSGAYNRGYRGYQQFRTVYSARNE
jgi:hypothetical protein